jgi:type II secretory pathway pseudopilin PulG
MFQGSLNRQDGFSLVDLLAAMLLIGIVSAMALPLTASSLAAQRFRGDAQGVANLVGLVKMRGAARYTRARLRVDLAANAYSMELWDRTAGTWTAEGGVRSTSPDVRFGFGALATPPPDTQAAIGFAPACRADDGVTAIAGTSCILFNSRGIPIDSAGTPVGGNALYLSSATGVYAITVTATPLVRFWWSPAHTAAWVEQQ